MKYDEFCKDILSKLNLDVVKEVRLIGVRESTDMDSRGNVIEYPTFVLYLILSENKPYSLSLLRGDINSFYETEVYTNYEYPDLTEEDINKAGVIYSN